MEIAHVQKPHSGTGCPADTQGRGSTPVSVSWGFVLTLTSLAWEEKLREAEGCGSQERWARAVWLPKCLLICSLN